VIHIGIDPGLGGAVAILDAAGGLLVLADVPVLTLTTARGRKQDYDVPGMVAILQPYGGLQAHVTLEEAQSMPGQGVRSMWTIGYGFGLWLGVLTALRLPYTRVRPSIWKRAMGLGKDKEQARLRAMQLFPAADLRRKRDHGRAESLLLAHYGRRQGTHTPASIVSNVL
jgi:crossover junction endodeoxyribonuclease RuvC